MWHVHFEVWRRHEEINVFATPKNDFATLEIGLCGKVISKCGPDTPFASRHITPTLTTDPNDTFYAGFLCFLDLNVGNVVFLT